MFMVIFEIQPYATARQQYLDIAKTLRPELEQIDGFVDNVRYQSLTRDGVILSLSSWRDEKSLVRWRTQARHHGAQELGREKILADYSLRAGQITADTNLPAGHELKEQRLDQTETGASKVATIITATRPREWASTNNPYDCAEWLGLNPRADAMTSWDIFDAVLSPGDLALVVAWADEAAADAFDSSETVKDLARIRRVRIVRDYSKKDRREAPQYFPEAEQLSDEKLAPTPFIESAEGTPSWKIR